MEIENRITIYAPMDRVFALGGAISNWPDILPHYRYVIVESDNGRIRQAEMAARRDWFPVWWRTSQVLIPEENKIIFFHTAGITRGMFVEWNLQPISVDGAEAVEVTIAHQLSYPMPFLTGWFARNVVGDVFVSHIAGQTLARIKQVAETESVGL